MPFVPCPSCRRHVRAGDGACPFCAAALPSDPQVVPAATTRLGRGALFAFAVGVAACSSSGDDGAPADTGVSDTGNPAPAYGAPVDASVTEGGVDGGPKDTGGMSAAYGLPPDTGVDATSPDTGASDAAADTSDTGGPAPAYGLPPVDAAK